MPYDSKRAEHTQMVLGMADRQGVDLQEMILRAEVSEDQFEHAVDRCMGCTQSTACKCLLDSAGPQLNLPEYCRNGDLFDALRSK
ncbi:DUF6455 family protein [Marivita sp.]|uniref:DUF6455 family protein n=1 Tax=Marivita sp. TaxID=2003365 RepID=UPI003F6F36C3